jgi:trk system potassium uptake protein TrkA
LERGHSVVVIEKDAEAAEALDRSAHPVLVINGDACDVRFQEEAQVDKADVFAAVTGDDDDNLVACQLAKVTFRVPRTVARINNPKNEHIFNLMGVDGISSTTIVGQLIEEESTVGDIITLYTMHKGKFAIVEVDIPSTATAACSKQIKDLGLPRGAVLVSIIRGEDVIIPHGEDMIRDGDSVIAVTSLENEEALKRVLTS